MELAGLPQYQLIEQRFLKELDSQGYLLRHRKTGARVFVLENQDNNKVFNIAFRTTPQDSTGVAHIIEHSVLCGSEKYPAKDPFVELAKGSLNTFLNAMTYPDKTMYPVASTNDKDFRNLISVYLDAVFHPNIVKDRRIFEQEGWHYELDSADGELIYNGVVYNEMKGAFSSAEEVLARHSKGLLYPDNTYANESGGDPECIPDLTYEDYLAFYRRYYHPSNSFIYLYGDQDMPELLAWIDREYLSRYDRLEIDSSVRLQQPFAQVKEAQIPYAVSEGSDEGVYLSWNRVVGTALDKELCLAFQILDYVLLAAPGAPLKQALLDKGIGVEIYGGYEDGLLQPSFTVTAKDADICQKEEFVKTIEDTLHRLVQEGLNKKSLLAGLNSLEFRLREADFGRWPKGLMFGLECFNSWLYDENDPFMHLETEETMSFLREQAKGRYFEELIRKWLLENTYGLVLVAVPQEGLEARKEAQTAARLKAYRDTLSAAELEKIIRHTAELKAYQEEPSLPEDLEKIPMLDVADIRREVLPLYNEQRLCRDIPVLFHQMFTSGIGYLELVFDADSLTIQQLPYMAFLKRCLGVVAAGDYSYQELMDEINIHTGGIEPGFVILQPQDRQEPAVRFSIRAKAFYAELDKAAGLIQDILYRSDLEDEKRLFEILGEARSQLHERLKSAGHVTAIKRASSYYSKAGYLNELTSGISYYEFLDDLYRHFQEKKEQLKRQLREVGRLLFHKESLLVSYTADEEGYARLRPVLESMSGSMSSAEPVKAEREFPLENKNEGFGCSSQIQFVVRSGSYAAARLPYTGHLLVLQNILNYDYLWIRLRVKGGAYGCFSGFGRDGEGYCASYLDPKLRETNEVYEQIPAYLQSFEADKRTMDRYIIGTVGEMDIPKNPAAMGSRGLTAYLLGISAEQLQREREQVLETSPEDIRKLKAYMEAILRQGCFCVVGNENKLREQASMFGSLKQL